MRIKEIAYKDIETGKTERKIAYVDSARRHVIRINNIEAKKYKYAEKSTFTSKELITYPVESIAIFVSEYIPEHFLRDKYITYIMTVNGIDYEIEPINSHRPGKKIIRHSKLNAGQPYAIYIDESIKSATLTIVMESEGTQESPFLSGIKVLYGRRVE